MSRLTQCNQAFALNYGNLKSFRAALTVEQMERFISPKKA
jgi:hypothetical protein